jgi:hypothetical protein
MHLIFAVVCSMHGVVLWLFLVGVPQKRGCIAHFWGFGPQIIILERHL